MKRKNCLYLIATIIYDGSDRIFNFCMLLLKLLGSKFMVRDMVSMSEEDTNMCGGPNQVSCQSHSLLELICWLDFGQISSPDGTMCCGS